MGVAKISFCLLFACAVIITSGCGRRGDPVPPELSAPAPVRMFAASAEDKSIVLSWLAPLTNASGEELINLYGFIVKRAESLGNDNLSFEDVGTIRFDPDKLKVENAPPFAFRDVKVEKGRVYYYKVTPFNDDDVEGEGAGNFRITFDGKSSIIERF